MKEPARQENERITRKDMKLIGHAITQSGDGSVIACMEIQKTRTWHATDKQAKKIIMDMTGCDNATSFQRLPVDIQNECIGKLKKSGASIRQISRLTGITYYAIQKVNHRTVP